MGVNDQLLDAALESLAAALPIDDSRIEVLGTFIRIAADDAIVRINPVRWAEENRVTRAAATELFLHARKIGLVTMDWQYVCPGCGEVVEHLGSLTSATAHYYCQTCSADREADMSDFVEVTFSIAPEIRRSPYHDPSSLPADEHFLGYRFAQSAVVDDGTPLRDHLRQCRLATEYVEPGATKRFSLTADSGYLWMTNGPALIVDDTERVDDVRTFAFEYTGVRSKGAREEIAPGPVDIAFTNRTAEPYPLLITMLPDHYEVIMQPFLSGAEVLSNQTFLDLFPTETIIAGEGLAVQRPSLLFTDLQGSTALYERIGDLKAFDLVRLHFGYLRDVIARNSGALVKTIGDAVMASFVDPLDGLRAALEMRTRIAEFNAEAGHDLISIKLGLHTGACLAVTLNDRLDYFGQTVNIAARVQGLAAGDEIVITDDILSVPGAAEIVAGLPISGDRVELRGVAGSVQVHRIGRTGADS
jgi:class 3 adenylate cyclase